MGRKPRIVKTVFDGMNIFHDMTLQTAAEMIDCTTSLLNQRFLLSPKGYIVKGYFVSNDHIEDVEEIKEFIRTTCKYYAYDTVTGEYCMGTFAHIREYLGLTHLTYDGLINNLHNGNRKYGDWVLIQRSNKDKTIHAFNIRTTTKEARLDTVVFKYVYDGYDIMTDVTYREFMEMANVYVNRIITSNKQKGDMYVLKGFLVSIEDPITDDNKLELVKQHSIFYGYNLDGDMVLGPLPTILTEIKDTHFDYSARDAIDRRGFYERGEWIIRRGTVR